MGLLALQSSPQFKNNNTVNVQAATQSRKAAKRFLASFKTQKQPVLISLSQTELNGLNALLNRAFPQVVSDIIIDNETVAINLSVELPLPSFMKHLNVSGLLYPSEKGIEFGDISIGGLTVSGNKLLFISRWLIDNYIQEELGTNLVSMVQWVRVNKNFLRLSLLIPEDINQLKTEKSGLLVLRDNLALFGDVTKIKFYHSALVTHLAQIKDTSNLSTKLPHYLQFILCLAKEKTLLNQYETHDSQAIQENYSALMALALYFGSDSFELLIGNVSNLNISQKKRRNFLMNKVTLRNRVDLQKHFMYSIALQLFGNSKASDAIGELKEFLDSNPGGSGFSFADLMADRAGTRLAKLATSSEESAINLQKNVSQKFDENDFMPEIEGLPEGISASVFNTNYRDVNSVEYITMISILDNKITELTLYK